MFIFAYSREWADLVIAQLAARHRTADPQHWSYACLCVGRKFDPILEKHYLEIDTILGPYLHVFSLFPPPAKFIAERYQKLRTPDDPLSERAKQVYEKLLTEPYRPAIDRKQMIHEKVALLTDLQHAGLRVDQYADFLFFGFHPNGEDIDLDVIAAATAPVDNEATPESFFEFFKSMALIAEKHYRANDDVAAFVDDLSLRWAIKLNIRKARDLCTYIKDFVAVAKA